MSDSIAPGASGTLAILPLRNSVLFPASVVPVNVGRPRSVRLIEDAFGVDRPTIGVVAQKRPEIEDPTFDEIHSIGTVARVLKVIRLSSGNYSVVLQGVARMRVLQGTERHPCMVARIERIAEPLCRDVEVDALAANVRELARKMASLVPGQSRESGQVLDNVTDPGALADLVASNLPIATELKQQVLELLDVRERLRRVTDLVSRQGEVYRVKKEIHTMVQEEMSRSQREYLLRQQMKQIRRELGESDGDEDDIEVLRDRVARAELPPEAEKAAKKQLSRMRSMSPAGSEYHVARQYVEWLADLPWGKATADRLNVAEARRVLDEDHHGLEKIKRRILEYIAVRKLRSDKKGPILCFVGPPGVGKTSLAKSIARATGREFVRISLGGVQDEAEVRGHRRTYVGSFPGRIVSGLKKAGSKNPVMILDEVDKLGSDHRGDPASALLEVLDPEQNNAFVDHYLEVPFDLGQVMFIATANRKDTIPSALLDRMETIELAGYTTEEKLAIAEQFLVPKQLSEHGLTPERLEFERDGVERLVHEYTREAGVRNLEQKVASVCRSVAVQLANGEDVHIVADAEYVEGVLGAPRHQQEEAETQHHHPGVATGLSWTPSGGRLMFVEATRMPGAGKFHLTGNVGDVMKEAVATAFSYVRARADRLGLPADFLQKLDVHIHLPQGSIPKDGPAAGLPVYVALASLLTRVKVRPDVAMSGEITLRGAILKVDGVKQKCLAAHRAKIKHLILPHRNEPDLDDVPALVRDAVSVHFVSRIEEALPIALEFDPLVAPAPAAAASM